MEQNNEIKEVVYEKASLLKRLIAYFFDISIWLLSSLILFTAVNSIVNSSSWYKSIENELIEIKNESKLYVDNVIVTTYITESNAFENIQQEKEFLTYSIDSFYSNTEYFDNQNHINEYNQRKLNAIVDGVHLFITDNDFIIENSVNPSYLVDFYSVEINDYALAFLFKNKNYSNLTSISFKKVIIEVLSMATLMFAVYYLVLPLTCFKRGRQTIGMRLEKIALIDVHALNVSTKKYVLRFIFMYFVFVIIAPLSFLIPCFISIGMMYLNKTNSSLTNYVFNDYMVDNTNQQIYLDEAERYLAKDHLEEVSIENKEIVLK